MVKVYRKAHELTINSLTIQIERYSTSQKGKISVFS